VPGAAVEVRTLLHQLRPDRAERLGRSEYRFCEAPDCDTVYFSTDGVLTFGAADLRGRVGLKMLGSASAPVCYCFGFTAGNLATELGASGSAEVPRRIRALVKARMCACEVRNPSGRCCLGEIARIVKLLTALESPRCSGAIDEGDPTQLSKEDV